MKKILMLLSILLCTGIAYGQIKKPAQEAATKKVIEPAAVTEQENSESLIKGWDINLTGGAVFYEDTTGYNGRFDTRVHFPETSFNMSFFAGAGGLYQYTKSSMHTINHTYGFGLLGFDYFFLKETVPSLALRTEIACGGGSTSDENADAVTVRKTGYIIYPSIGLDYSFGPVHLGLMYGYEVLGVSSTNMRSSSASISIGYRIF